MTNKDQKVVISSVVRVLRALGLGGLYARFAPIMRYGNQPDTPIIATNKTWFLRENWFLVFTRGGPIEVTLKPSLVLTGILICMAGVAGIFYSTIIASYSAIGVMRDETIKTAQASVNPKDGAAFSKDDIATNALKWFDYDPTSLEDSHPPSIIGKTAQPPSLIVGRITTQPAVTTPQTPQASPDTKISKDTKIPKDAKIIADDAMPMIIQGGKRVTLASNAASANSQFGDEASFACGLVAMFVVLLPNSGLADAALLARVTRLPPWMIIGMVSSSALLASAAILAPSAVLVSGDICGICGAVTAGWAVIRPMIRLGDCAIFPAIASG